MAPTPKCARTVTRSQSPSCLTLKQSGMGRRSLSMQFNALQRAAASVARERLSSACNAFNSKVEHCAKSTDADDEVQTSFLLLREAVASGMYDPPRVDYLRYQPLKGCVICVEGIISAGKTTLGKEIANFLNFVGLKAEFFPEYVEESLLHLFYSDPVRYAFAFQIFMLRSCQASMSLARYKAKCDGTICIVDRSLWGNAVFAALQVELGNMSTDEWTVYLNTMAQKGPYKADYVIYLDCDPNTSLARMRSRNRQSENAVPLEYLETLERHYTTKMLLHLSEKASNIVPFNWNTYGSVVDVLDTLLKNRTYDVSGDMWQIFRKSREFRSGVVRKLVEKGEVIVSDDDL